MIFFFNDTATTEIYTLSLHDALPIWWNPAVENQATDRAFRIGQTKNVQVHKFVSTGTLEEKIHEMIESKKAMAEQVVGAGEQWLTELDTDALRNLLLLDRSAVIEEDD